MGAVLGTPCCLVLGVSPQAFRRRVAARIQRARWRLGLTQQDAAHRIGLVYRHYAEVERGHRNPSLDTVFAIAGALKVRVADLVDVEPGPRVDLDSLKLSAPKTGRKPSR
jgi:transcriptional regulator with XRE-family HTH domain